MLGKSKSFGGWVKTGKLKQDSWAQHRRRLWWEFADCDLSHYLLLIGPVVESFHEVLEPRSSDELNLSELFSSLPHQNPLFELPERYHSDHLVLAYRWQE